MGLKVTMDRASIIKALELVGRDTSRAAFNALKEEGKEIANLASDMAPRDDNGPVHLDESIVSQPVLRENAVYVGIDPRRSDEHGTPMNFYGALMHEMLAPYGSGAFNLGPDSAAKDGGTGIVGGKFLTRAFEKRRKAIMQHVLKEVKRIYR